MKSNLKNTIICDFPVIQQIINDYWEFRGDHDASQDDLSASLYWFSLLSTHAELVINIGESDFDELSKTNPIFKRLKKNSMTGGSKIQLWKDHVDMIEKDKRFEDFPNALYLLNCSENICSQKIRENGLIFLNGKNYKTFTETLFLLTDLQVNKDSNRSDISSWNDFKRLTHPMNCMILTDNYIIKDKADIAINLIPLLNALLPENLDNSMFQLMIITQEMEPAIFSSRYNEICNQIKNMKRNYEVEFSLITTSSSNNHDRRIFTNYCMFESNNSFTYFDLRNNVKKNTTLHSFPYCMISSGQELMLNKNLNTLAEVKKLLVKHVKQKLPDSTIVNRLLTMVSN